MRFSLPLKLTAGKSQLLTRDCQISPAFACFDLVKIVGNKERVLGSLANSFQKKIAIHASKK